MAKNYTRKFLQIQGFNLNDEALKEIGQWMRWPYVLCASFLTVGLLLASPGVLWALSTVALATVFLPSHPFNYVYNYGVRYLAGTRPLPPSTIQGRFSCGVGGVWLIATGAAFYAGASTVGYALGVPLVAIAGLVATTQLCIPSLLFNTVCNLKEAQPA